MLSNIIIRELMDHVKSLRLLITFVLLVILMSVSSLLFLQEHKQEVADYNQNINETRETISNNVQSSGALFRLLSFNWQGPFVYKSPNHLAFISDGQGKNLPNSFSTSAFKIYGPFKKIRSNIFLGHFSSLDWSLIFGVILSFAAIVLVYDSICGEKENGTLSLTMANDIPRSVLLAGKFLGGLAALGVPVLLGSLIQLLILTMGGIDFAAADWFRFGMSLVFTFLYLSTYLMLGLFISARSHNSSTSLVVNLLVWALLVVIIPGVSGMVAKDLVKVPRKEAIEAQAYTALQDEIKSYNEKYPELKSVGRSGHWSPGEPLERAIAADDAWSEVIENFRNKQIEQVITARKVTFLSPTAVYQSGLESTAESGIYHYIKFYKQILDFKLRQRQFLYDRYPLPGRWFYPYGRQPSSEDADNYDILNAIKISLKDVPQFEETRLSLTENLQTSLPYYFMLFLFVIVFYLGAHLSFQRYDVR